MSITVFVWDPGTDAYGHASLSIDGGAYVSWWPSDQKKGEGKLLGPMLGSRAYSSTMKQDKLAEKRIPSWASAPIRCLDEAAITRWWRQQSGRLGLPSDRTRPLLTQGHYSVLRASCAGKVFEAMEVGGLHRSPAGAATAAEIRKGSIITPNDIKDLAMALSGEQGFWDVVKFQVPTDVRNAWIYLF